MAALNQEQAVAQSRRLMVEGIPHMVRPRSWSKAFFAIMVPEPEGAADIPAGDLTERLATEAEVDGYLTRVKNARRPIRTTARIISSRGFGEENHIFLIDSLGDKKNYFAYIARTDNGLSSRPRGLSNNGRFSLVEIRERHGILNGPDGKRYMVIPPADLFNHDGAK